MKGKTMGKHTPGPWKWDESWGAIMTDHNNPSRLISPVWTGCNPRGMGPEAEAEDAANARLIAAAPELLECCRLALSLIGTDEESANGCPRPEELAIDLREIIAKATA